MRMRACEIKLQLEEHVCMCGGEICIKNNRDLLGDALRTLTPFPIIQNSRNLSAWTGAVVREAQQGPAPSHKRGPAPDVLNTLLTPVHVQPPGKGSHLAEGT